jgi:hypothetical protein
MAGGGADGVVDGALGVAVAVGWDVPTGSGLAPGSPAGLDGWQPERETTRANRNHMAVP